VCTEVDFDSTKSSNLQCSAMKTAMLLPSIMRRVDDLLLVKEMNAKFFDHSIREDLLHNALCTPSAGLEYNYERLELLGKDTSL
jgi:endoribonuclease Dicer